MLSNFLPHCIQVCKMCSHHPHCPRAGRLQGSADPVQYPDVTGLLGVALSAHLHKDGVTYTQLYTLVRWSYPIRTEVEHWQQIAGSGC